MVATRHPVIRKAARVTSYVFRRGRALYRAAPGRCGFPDAPLVASIGGCCFGSLESRPGSRALRKCRTGVGCTPFDCQRQRSFVEARATSELRR